MKNFRGPKQSMITWLAAKGRAGNVNEMLLQHFISLNSYLSGATLRDYLVATLGPLVVQPGDSVPELKRIIDLFFITKMSIADPVQAEAAFWADSSKEFN